MVKRSDESDESKQSESARSPKLPPGSELLTTQELMSYLNLSRTKVWEMVKKGQIPAFRIGGDYRYRRSEIDEWLETQRVQGEKQPPESK